MATRERPTPPPLPWFPAGARPASSPTRRSAPRRLLAAHRRATSIALGILVLALAVPAVLMLQPSEPTGPHLVTTPFLTYTAPPGWTPEPAHPDEPDASPLPAVLAGVVHGPGYSCAGEPHLRGYAATALLPPDAAVKPPVRAENLARWFAAASYADGTPAEVSAAFTRPMQVPGRDGPVDATLTEVTAQAGGRESCAALEGTVLALAAPVSGGVAVLLLAGDTRGGPTEPTPPDRAALDGVIASARLG